MKKLWVTSLGLIAISSSLWAAEGQPSLRDPADVPSQVTATILDDQTLDLRLPACFSCGADWTVVGQNENFLKSSSESIPHNMVEGVNINPGFPYPLGGNNLQVLHFPKLDAGTYQYQIQYGRVSAKDEIKPVVLLNLTVSKSGHPAN